MTRPLSALLAAVAGILAADLTDDHDPVTAAYTITRGNRALHTDVITSLHRAYYPAAPLADDPSDAVQAAHAVLPYLDSIGRVRAAARLALATEQGHPATRTDQLPRPTLRLLKETQG